MNQKLKKSILTLLLFCVLMIVSLVGVVLPSKSSVEAIGTMQIAPFSAGLSLYQGYRGLFYSFSPFNDFYIDGKNNRSALISRDEIEHQTYTVTDNPSLPKKIFSTVTSYLGILNTSLTFHIDNGNTFAYTTSQKGNTLTLTSTILLPHTSGIKIIGNTLTYQADDIIFDNQKNVYNFWKDTDLATFDKTYDITLTPKMDEIYIPIPDKTIYITNPNASFIIKITAGENQTLYVNRNSRLIEVQTPAQEKNNRYKTSVTVQIFENPKEALK